MQNCPAHSRGAGKTCPVKADMQQAGSTAGIDPDDLGFGEVLDGSIAMLAPKARIARTAPGQPDIRRPIGVDPDGPGLQLPREPVRPRNIAGPDTGSQAVDRAIGNAERILLVAERNDRRDRAEDFLLSDAHFVLHAGKDRRLDEISLL